MSPNIAAQRILSMKILSLAEVEREMKIIFESHRQEVLRSLLSEKEHSLEKLKTEKNALIEERDVYASMQNLTPADRIKLTKIRKQIYAIECKISAEKLVHKRSHDRLYSNRFEQLFIDKCRNLISREHFAVIYNATIEEYNQLPDSHRYTPRYNGVTA